MTRRGMLIIMTIGALGLVLMLIMLQQALVNTRRIGPLLQLRRQIEQTFEVEGVKVRRNQVSSMDGEPSGQEGKRFWIVVRMKVPSSKRDDETFARTMIDEVERMYEGDRRNVHGYRLEFLSSGDPPSVKLLVKKTRGPAPTTVTRPGKHP